MTLDAWCGCPLCRSSAPTGPGVMIELVGGRYDGLRFTWREEHAPPYMLQLTAGGAIVASYTVGSGEPGRILYEILS